MSRRVCVRISERMYNKLVEIARESDYLELSELIRDILRKYIEEKYIEEVKDEN